MHQHADPGIWRRAKGQQRRAAKQGAPAASPIVSIHLLMANATNDALALSPSPVPSPAPGALPSLDELHKSALSAFGGDGAAGKRCPPGALDCIDTYKVDAQVGDPGGLGAGGSERNLRPIGTQ